MKRTGYALFLFAVSIVGAQLQAQVPTGTPAFGGFGGGPFDTVNLGNLNAHFAIRVRQKPGRGMPFVYDISYDTSIWYPVGASGYQTWQPVSGYGWNFAVPPSGSLTDQIVQTVTQPCDPQHNNWTPVTYNVYAYFVYHDINGNSHPIGGGTSDYQPNSYCPAVNPPWAGTGSAYDGSAYTMTYAGINNITITGPDGMTVYSTNWSNTSTDANGNQITMDSSGNYIDTLGQSGLNALQITGTSPRYLNYTAPNGNTAAWKVNYGTYTIHTNFGCSGVAEYTATNAQLPSSIVQPDGSSYQFTYEQTQGSPSGTTTGRLLQVTLPTGGTITYTYPTTNNGNNNAINCADGSAPAINATPSLTRTLNPGGNWMYYRTQVSGNHWQTKVTSPLSDDTVIDFQQDSTSGYTATQNFFPTQSVAYQGSATSGTVLATIITCYNTANPTPSSCPGTSISTPIARVVAFSYLGNTSAKVSKTDTQYSFVSHPAFPTEIDSYDLGSGGPGSIVRKVINTYAAYGNSVRLTQSTVKDGANNVKAQSTYAYDQTGLSSLAGTPQHVSVSGGRGNLTSVTKQVSGSVTLYQVLTYYDTGMVKTTTDWGTSSSGGPNVTSYNYPDATSTCGNAFATSMTLPSLGATPSSTFNCIGGVATQTQDLNGNATNIAYDAYWRVASASYPAGGLDSYTYGAGSASVTKTSKINASSNLVTQTIFDGMGRVSSNRLTSDPSGTDYVDTSYDSIGRVYSVTNPYRSTNDPTYGVTYYSYDALGRTTRVTNPDSTTVQTTYGGAAVQVQNEAGHTRVSQMDGLGRLTSVCEVTNASQMSVAPGACSQDIAATGFLTTYGYDVLGNLTNVTQGNQTRSYAYDELSRLTYEWNPESPGASTNYAYDSCSAGDLCSRTRPAPNQTGPATVTTSYSYDALHRLTQKSYSDGTTPAVGLYYDETSIWGVNPSNPKGRLTHQGVNAQGGGCTANVFSYDAMGRVIAAWPSTPLNCGTGSFPLQFSYDLLGDKISMYNQRENVTYSYSFNAAAQLTGMQSTYVDSTHPGTLLTVNQYNPLGQVQQATLGNGIVRTNAFDNRGRLTSQTDGSVYNFALDYAGDSNIQTGNDSINGNWSYAYDDFGRVATSTGLLTFQNTDFESSSSLPPPGWSAGSATLSYDTSTQFAGERSLKTAATGIWGGAYSIMLNGVPGQTYTVSGYVKSDGTCQAYIQIRFLNSGGSYLGSAQTGATTQTTWQFVTATNVAPAGTVYVQLGLPNANPSGAGVCEFDNITASSSAQQTFTYAYDRYGNRWQQNAPQGGPAPQYSFDANNHINDGTVTYDAAGNVINDGFHSYTYDAENRLIAVDGGSTASYVYDAQGLRVHETLFGNPSDYIFGDQGRVITLLGGAVWDRSELYAGDMHVATYADGTTYFDHSDWLGTVRARSYPNGSVAVNCTSLAFGDALNCTGPYASPIHFTGLDHDGEDNLDHTLFRQYSSTEGRWTTPDPAGLAAVDPANPQSWNRYAYVGNNPMAATDPTGLFGWDMLCGTDIACCPPGQQFGPFASGGCGGNGGGMPCLIGIFGGCASGGLMPLGVGPGNTSGILPGEGSVNVPLGSGNPFTDLWGALGLPSGLNCPNVGGLSSFLCGGVNPIMDVEQNGRSCLNGAGPLALGQARCGLDFSPRAIRCTFSGMGKLALDYAGFIPGEGLFHSLFGIGLGWAGAAQGDTVGTVGAIAGIHLSALELTKSKMIKKANPLLNLGQTLYDNYTIRKDYNNCVSGAD